MISAARASALAAAAGATLLIAGAAAPDFASAQEECKGSLVTASGRGKYRPFTRAKELEGKGAAMADAVASWQREVATTYGDRWKLWSEAKDKSFECGITQGKILSNLVACTIKGRPCPTPETGPSPASGPAAEVRKVVPGRVTRPESGEEDYRGTSWRYRHEMQRQAYLAEHRRRMENYAREREEARQRWLEASRERSERYARERAEAREHYLEQYRDRWE